jgi:hypothetical protein
MSHNPWQVAHFVQPASTEPPQPLAPAPTSPNLCLIQNSASMTDNATPPTPEEIRPFNIRSWLPPFYQAALHQPPTCVSHAETDSRTCSNHPSRPESSMLAHCDQNSSSHPCEPSAHLGLRQAVIPRSRLEVPLPPLPLEKAPLKRPQSSSPKLFQRLVRKTFGKPLPALPHASVSSTDSTARASRCSIYFSFARTEPILPERNGSLDLPKKSRWRIAQRFISKPSAAARAAALDVNADASLSVAHDRSSLPSGHSSTVSFFGDATTRVDPFARASGLGAVVSDIVVSERLGHPVRRSSVAAAVSAHTLNGFAHVVRFPAGEEDESTADHRVPTMYQMAQ